MEGVFRDGGRWAAENAGLIAALAAVIALLGLILLVVSLIAQGGMARATADVALDRPISSRAAWETGVRLFWRYLALWILMILLFIALGLVLAAFGGIVFLFAQYTGGIARTILVAVTGLLAFLAFLVAIPVSIAIAVAAAFAQRAIAVEDSGPAAGLGTGFRLLRNHLGAGALVWLINLALSIAAGLAIAVVFVVLLIPLGALAAALFAITGVSAASISFVVAAALVLIAAVWVMGGIANTFFWNYWTLAYLNLTGRLTDRLEPTTED